MQNILKNRIIQIIGGVILAIAMISLLAWSFQKDTYASMKDCEANPPFEGVYWGMTIPEFCEAMGIKESDLVKVEPWTYDDWKGIGSLKRQEEYYGISAEEMPLYEHYENHFDLQLTEEILGTTDYYLGDKEQTIRVVFTDETTWNGKTVPPLLCFILFQAPFEQSWKICNTISVLYAGEEAREEQAGIAISHDVNLRIVNWTAYTLSHMYSCGMSPEEIAAYDIKQMDRDKYYEINCPVYEAVRPRQPGVAIAFKSDKKDWGMVFDSENAYIYMHVGYLPYYEWFLNELT